MANATLEDKVQYIINEVKAKGDTALKNFALTYDQVAIEEFRVSAEEITASEQAVSQELKDAITLAATNIGCFHRSQLTIEPVINTMKGVSCWRKNVGIEKVGLYIPGGSAPLFSTILMLAIPAVLAGCKRIVLCTPCNSQSKIHPAILYTASFLGIKEIYKVGGAQAIAALAYGTESIPKVDKIFGPGNQYVTKAKTLVQKAGTAIDLPAGPSEVLIIADETAHPDFVAADLLAQAEHGNDSQVVLLSNREATLAHIQSSIAQQLKALPRADIAQQALENSYSILLRSIDACIDFSNEYAPEHLILSVQDPAKYQDTIINAGSVFLGHFTPESAGDYASGTNHTLPTNGYATSYSGVSVDSFLKKITFQQITAEGLKNIGSAVEVMAEAEGLAAHKNAVSIRLATIKNK